MSGTGEVRKCRAFVRLRVHYQSRRTECFFRFELASNAACECLSFAPRKLLLWHAMKLFIQQNGEQSGPFTLVEVQARVRERSFSANTDLAWHEALDAWQLLGRVLFITLACAAEAGVACVRGIERRNK